MLIGMKGNQLSYYFFSLCLLVLNYGCQVGGSAHEKAIKEIMSQEGIVLADVNDSYNNILMYSTPKGLYYWDLRNKQPKRLYSNLDSLRVHGYYLTDNYILEEYDSEYPKEIEYFDEDGESKYRPNVIQSISPLKLYKVEWPWIMIGQHYIAHVSKPNLLLDIAGDEKGGIFYGLPDLFDPESRGDGAPSFVDIDKNGNLILNVGQWAFNLPGIREYKPSSIDENTWRNRVYLDKNLVKAYGNLFQSEYELESAIGISLPYDNFIYRKVVINPHNKVASKNEFVWGDYSFEDSNLTSNGMQSTYRSIEKKYSEIIEETLPQKRNEIEQYAKEYRNNMIAQLKETAIPLSDIVNGYQRNRRKALQDYPLDNNYIIRAYIGKIEYSSSGNFKYRLVNKNYFEDTFFYTSDPNFTNLDYPCTVYMNASYYDYEIGYDGDQSYFYFTNAQLLFVEE